MRKVLLLTFVFLVGSTSTFAQSAKLNDQTAPPELISQVKRAVVVVTTYNKQSQPLQQGSGFFISPETIVTNFHVINSADQIRIKTFAGETVAVKTVAAADPQADLALLQLSSPCHDTTSLQVADVSPVEGESLVVVSNPKGGSWKVTAGQVATTWNFEHLGTRMQITASLKPGSSGGPVVNLQGYVIGVAAMHTASADDLDFAVPAERLKNLQNRPESPTPRN